MSGTNGVAVAPDFSHLAALAIDGKRAWFELPEKYFGKGAAVEGVSAHASYNSAYAAGKLGASSGRNMLTEESDPETWTRWRAEDRLLYAQHVLTDWRNIKTAKGEVVAFSQEMAIAFLRVLPTDLFDSLRGFFNKPDNFRKPIEVAEIAGNSDAGSSSN